MSGMSYGGPVDPESGEPMEKVEADRRAYEKRLQSQEAERLKGQAGLNQVTQGEAADALRAMIRRRLELRIQAVLDEDPEARAYVAILKDLREKGNLAAIATEKLVKAGHL